MPETVARHRVGLQALATDQVIEASHFAWTAVETTSNIGHGPDRVLLPEDQELDRFRQRKFCFSFAL